MPNSQQSDEFGDGEDNVTDGTGSNYSDLAYTYLGYLNLGRYLSQSHGN